MTPKVKQLVVEIETSELYEKVITDPMYGRGSVVKDFDTTPYLAEKALKEVKARYSTSNPIQDDLSERERSQEPIEAKQWKVPEKWVYDKNYIYNADDGKYVFTTREFGNVVRPKSWVKSLVQAYSDWDGDAATITEICRRFGITRSLFNEIKKVLGLTHDHEPFTPDEVHDKSVEEMAMEAHQMKRFRTKIEFDKLDWKETQKEAKKWRNLKQSILDELSIELPEIEINPIRIDNLPKGTNQPRTVIVETTDWHLGAYAKGLPSVPDFSARILQNYLDKIVQVIRTRFPESEVVVHFMGDIMETVTGMNHPDSWKNIEDGYYGSKVILESINLLSDFIANLRASRLVAVTGNHGRLTSDKKRDHDGEAEIIVYEQVSKMLPDVDVRYGAYRVFDYVDGIAHILTHGHNKAAKKEDIARILSQISENPEFVMYKQGHTHSRNIIEDTDLYRHYTVPALFTGHKYNQRNGYGHRAGFNLVYKNPLTGNVTLEDYTL